MPEQVARELARFSALDLPLANELYQLRTGQRWYQLDLTTGWGPG